MRYFLYRLSYYLLQSSNQHVLAKGQEEGKIWVWGRHQQDSCQEAEHAATSATTPSPKRILSREA